MKFIAVLLSVLSVLLLVGCGREEDKFPTVQTVKDGGIVPIIANSEITVGWNRMAFGILGEDGTPIVDAKGISSFTSSPVVKRKNGSRLTRSREYRLGTPD